MTRYAASTSVSVSTSKAEIEKIVDRYAAHGSTPRHDASGLVRGAVRGCRLGERRQLVARLPGERATLC